MAFTLRSKPQPQVKKPEPQEPQPDFQTETDLPVSRVTLPRRGRGQEIEVEMLGELRQTPTGGQFLDVTAFRDQSIEELIEVAEKLGVQNPNVTEMLAAGVNAMLERQARGIGRPTLADRLITEGLSENIEEARITAMHLLNVIRRKGGTEDDALEFLRSLKAA